MLNDQSQLRDTEGAVVATRGVAYWRATAQTITRLALPSCPRPSHRGAPRVHERVTRTPAAPIPRVTVAGAGVPNSHLPWSVDAGAPSDTAVDVVGCRHRAV